MKNKGFLSSPGQKIYQKISDLQAHIMNAEPYINK